MGKKNSNKTQNKKLKQKHPSTHKTQDSMRKTSKRKEEEKH
jgi:hypothetical protein